MRGSRRTPRAVRGRRASPRVDPANHALRRGRQTSGVDPRAVARAGRIRKLRQRGRRSQTLQTRPHETRVAEVHQSAESARAVERHHASRDGRGNGQRRALSRARARTPPPLRPKEDAEVTLEPNLCVVAVVRGRRSVRRRGRRRARAPAPRRARHCRDDHDRRFLCAGSNPRAAPRRDASRFRLARRSAKASSDARVREEGAPTLVADVRVWASETRARAEARPRRSSSSLWSRKSSRSRSRRWERLVRLSARAMMSASRASRSRSERQRSYAKRLARAPTRRSGGGSVWACGTAPVGATVGRRRGGRARDARLRRDLRPVGVGALVATGRGVVRGRRADARASRGRRGGGHTLGDVTPAPAPASDPVLDSERPYSSRSDDAMRTASWTRRAARARASSSSRADHPASSRRDSSGADPRPYAPGASLPATRDAPPLRREPESREATTGRLDAFYAPGASAPSTLLLIECAVDDPVKTHRLRARNRSSRPSDSFVPPLRLVRSRARASRRRVSCLVILRQPILMIVLLRGPPPIANPPAPPTRASLVHTRTGRTLRIRSATSTTASRR